MAATGNVDRHRLAVIAATEQCTVQASSRYRSALAWRGAARLVQLCRMEDFSETGNNKLWRNVTHADRPFDPVRQCRVSWAAVPL
jgi:hypothetical protein